MQGDNGTVLDTLPACRTELAGEGDEHRPMFNDEV